MLSLTRNPQILIQKNILNYDGEITFQVKSEDNRYSYYYSLDGSEFHFLDKTKSNHILSKKYTGAYLGIFASSNGKKTKEHANFDWVRYKGSERH